MKKLLIVIVFLFSAACNLIAQQNNYSTFYYQRASLFENLPIDSTDIVFLGNSITNFGEWSEIFKDIHIKTEELVATGPKVF